MLLKPTVPGLCAMLQTIYETESCFSSDSTSSRERPVELLPQSRSTSMPSTGELERERDNGLERCTNASMLEEKCTGFGRVAGRNVFALLSFEDALKSKVLMFL